MAVPTITSLTPSEGPAGGGSLVRIDGTNFRTYTPPSYGYVGGTAPVYVEVQFNGQDALKVDVESSTSLWVQPPLYTGDLHVKVFPRISVRVRNLDDSLVPIPGEEATKTSAYQYVREALRPPTLATESPFVRVTEALLLYFKRQLLFDSGMTTHTDYSAFGIEVAKMDIPSVFLQGPDVAQDDYGFECESVEDAEGSDVYVYPYPSMYMLEYRVIGTANGDVEYMRLMAAVARVIRKYPWLTLECDIPEDTQLRLPLVMTGEPTTGTAIPNSNMRAFNATVEVRRVPVVHLPPYLITKIVDTIELQAQYSTGTLVEVINL